MGPTKGKDKISDTTKANIDWSFLFISKIITENRDDKKSCYVIDRLYTLMLIKVEIDDL